MKTESGVGVEAFEEAADGMLVLDENHTIISVNAAFCRLLGCDARGLLGRKAEVVFPREAAFRNDTAIQRLRGDKRLLGGCQLKRSDGMLLPVEVSIRGLPDGRLLGIVRDISERTKISRGEAPTDPLGHDRQSARFLVRSGVTPVMSSLSGRAGCITT